MKPDTTPASQRPGYDPLHELECDLWTASRARGALRAVQCLVQPWRHSEAPGPDLVENVSREDLAQLLEVIHSDLTKHLDQLEGHVHVLQGYGRDALDVMNRARGI